MCDLKFIGEDLTVAINNALIENVITIAFYEKSDQVIYSNTSFEQVTIRSKFGQARFG